MHCSNSFTAATQAIRNLYDAGKSTMAMVDVGGNVVCRVLWHNIGWLFKQGNNRLLAECSKCDSQSRRKDNSKQPDVDILYRYFLSRIYGHIRDRFLFPPYFGLGATWDTAAVGFIFGVPATWRQHDVKRFFAITRDAGFGFGSHRIGTWLTEPQAVAVYAAYQ
ncbi:hypothetical protein PG994_010060 [Apiospora phragmitis]|uniref:Uncharacterized protein n=1 Tax=Apiospora phragmitis TaxID=2905665 RepID=A0ABR1TNU3_9PEZI